MNILIHPLVIMSIADHYTREKIQFKKKRVIGALFGKQSGRTVHILDSFEIASEEKDGKLGMKSSEAFERDTKLFEEAYPGNECLGWYSTGNTTQEGDSEMHKTMMNYNERPLYLMMDPGAPEDSRELPIAIYEEEVHIVKDTATTNFVKTPYQIHSDEAERITAVHCAKVVTGDQTGSAVIPHYKTLNKAIKMLNQRIKVLLTILQDMESGKIKADHRIMRDIKGLCNRLPTMSSDVFKQDFLNEYNDDLLVIYLATITKGTGLVSEVMEKFNVTLAPQSRGGHGSIANY